MLITLAFLFLKKVGIEKINIESFLLLAKQSPIIDVRSPAEYQHAHIPGAYSLPLFTNDERAIVGTAYKQESREKAIKLGLDFFGPKMKLLVENVEELCASNLISSKTILIYCWRGGLRSATVAWLLDMYGFKVFTLTGGYKNFRKYVLETFRADFNLHILGGYTGSGKTELLHQLEKKGEAIIDLEKSAHHKGSTFGNIGLQPQPTQEMFENILATNLNQFVVQKQKIWIEDESQRIGLVNIPNDFWNNMRKAPVYFLDVDFEERLHHIVEEYGILEKQKMIDAIGRIQQRLGGLETKNAIDHLLNNDTVSCFRILLTYYDRWYEKGLSKRKENNSALSTISCKNITPLNVSKLLVDS